ncbi:MAG: basic secretory family protein [Syntrophobacteraceae bacterium]|jgi:hypothetical protein|nr:basic secretory family protein [Syntrophobacteraceae bacterium]
MVIADNQAKTTHKRFASGKGGKTPTDYFLRAPNAGMRAFAAVLDVVAAHPAPEIEQIIRVASDSSIMQYHWNNRGRAPAGYIKGMAVTYARAYCKLKAGDVVAREMAKPVTGDNDRDALAWYNQKFLDAGLHNDCASDELLRRLFVLMIGLGMRESSGRYCEGRDRSASNTNSSTAEAGLFQTSYNAKAGSPLMPQLFTQYAGRADFLDIFKEGVKARDLDLENYGSGEGREFQRLSKVCPAFAVEFAAVGLRNIRKHWGPIKRREAEVRQECDDMLLRVQKAVDTFNLCTALV